jgi:hypothetical protein
MGNLPRVTFGIIVLNGEPFTRYCLRSVYPFAYEIIAVEGAVAAAAGVAAPDGHSTDGTLQTLYDFKANEDPGNKVHIVVRDGLWSEKDEQSQAYADLATGDYLWQVDIDEFYRPEDMRTVLQMLSRDPEIASVSFRQITFWGGFDYVADGWYLRRGGNVYHRVFKWGPGYRYVTHRPPTVYDAHGRDLRSGKWIRSGELARRGIFLYHYSLVFPRQVMEKCAYYDRAPWVNRTGYTSWAESSFLPLNHAFRVHNVYDYPSWLERFHGQHPPQIEAMRGDIESGQIQVEIRQPHDVDRLLRSPTYRMGRVALKLLDHVDRWGRKLWRSARLSGNFLLRSLQRTRHLPKEG